MYGFSRSGMTNSGLECVLLQGEIINGLFSHVDGDRGRWSAFPY